MTRGEDSPSDATRAPGAVVVLCAACLAAGCFRMFSTPTPGEPDAGPDASGDADPDEPDGDGDADDGDEPEDPDGDADDGDVEDDADEDDPPPPPESVLVALPTAPDTYPIPGQRRVLYAEGRTWVFFDSEGSLWFTSSPDGEVWEPPVLAGAGESPLWQVSVAGAGNQVHVAFAGFALNAPVVYRRGVLSAAGSIAWTAEQTARAGDARRWWRTPTIGVDTSGRPLIAYHEAEEPTGPGCCLFYGLHAVASSAADGSWTTYAGWPQPLSDLMLLWHASPVALADGSIVIVYGNGLDQWFERVFDAGDLGSETAIGTDMWVFGFATVAVGDEVHLLYATRPDGILRHGVRDETGTWRLGAEVPRVEGDQPTLSVLGSSGGDLGAAWGSGDRVMVSSGIRGSDAVYSWSPAEVECLSFPGLIDGSVDAAPVGDGSPDGLLVLFLAEDVDGFQLRAVRCPL